MGLTRLIIFYIHKSCLVYLLIAKTHGENLYMWNIAIFDPYIFLQAKKESYPYGTDVCFNILC
jgi:hypothetical protein